MNIAKIDTQQKVLIMAEIGNNHEGRFDVACDLVRHAGWCGADAVKFQTISAGQLVSEQDQKRFQQLKGFELSHKQFEALAAEAHNMGLLFISTPFDLGSAAFLEPLVDAYKIASGDLTFSPLLKKVAATGKPLIISTGASDLDMIAEALAVVQGNRANDLENVALLHCVSSYPAPVESLNLNAIRVLAETYGCEAGYSDHALGNDACVLAVAAGARIVEKHFTLDKQFSDFRDHALSADPEELKQLVARVRQAETILGQAEKKVQPVEEGIATAIRRSIAAARDLPAGHVLTLDDMTWLRPAGGLEPGREGDIVGKTLKSAVRKGSPLQPEDIEATQA